jgi:hypothetical protein
MDETSGRVVERTYRLSYNLRGARLFCTAPLLAKALARFWQPFRLDTKFEAFLDQSSPEFESRGR